MYLSVSCVRCVQDHAGKQYASQSSPGVKREPSDGGAGGAPEPLPSSHARAVTGPADEEGLAEFSRMLSVFTHCGRLKVVAQLQRSSNQHSSSILSSIEFDRDSEVGWSHVSNCMPSCMFAADADG